jgi:hypothetical protein
MQYRALESQYSTTFGDIRAVPGKVQLAGGAGADAFLCYYRRHVQGMALSMSPNFQAPLSRSIAPSATAAADISETSGVFVGRSGAAMTAIGRLTV